MHSSAKLYFNFDIMYLQYAEDFGVEKRRVGYSMLQNNRVSDHLPKFLWIP